MNITLSLLEIAALDALRKDTESVEDVAHRLLAPVVADSVEIRVQKIAQDYRRLPPAEQLAVAADIATRVPVAPIEEPTR